MSGYELSPEDPLRLASAALSLRETALQAQMGETREEMFTQDALLTALTVFGISGAAPADMSELLARRGVSNDPAEAQLFGYDVGFSERFGEARELTEGIPVAAGSIALTAAHNFSLSILPHLPPRTVVVAAGDLTTFAWSVRTQGILKAVDSKEEYRDALFDPAYKIEGDLDVLTKLANVGRSADPLKVDLAHEEWLIKGMHFLSSDAQFKRTQWALDPTHPDGKRVITVPFDITTSGEYGFDNWISALSSSTEGLITWANVSDIGDSRWTNLQTAIGQNVIRARRKEDEERQEATNERWPLDEECTILSSTRVHHDDEANPTFMGTWRAVLPPHTNLDTNPQAFNMRLAYGTTAYPVR